MKKFYIVVLINILTFAFSLSASRLHDAVSINLSGNVGPRTCAVGDLNNDGYDDIVVACMNAKKIIILYSTGIVGSFNQYTINTKLSNLNVDIADIDNNGLNDIAFAEKGPGLNNHVGIYYQTSLGSFTNTIYSNYGDRPIKVADADNDGKLDLCSVQDYRKQVSKNEFTVRKLYNTEFGNSSWSSSVGGNLPAHYFDIVDINNDGLNDVLTMSDPPAKIYITFPGTSISEKIVSITGSYDFISADINNDGLKDFITSYFSWSTGGYNNIVKLKIYKQTSLFNFSMIKEIDILNDYTPGFNMYLNSADRILMIADDFNNDGKTDIAFVLTQQYKYNYLYVAYQNNDNSFDNPMIYSIPSDTAPAFFGIASGDFNKDGKNDIVVSDYDNSKIYVFYQNSTLPEIKYVYPQYNESIKTLVPEIKFKGYDFDNDSLKYKLELYAGSEIINVYNQFESTNGWNKASYQSGEEVSFQLPENNRLTEGKEYTLKIFAYDGIEWSDAKILKFNTGLINNESESKDLIFTPNNDGNNDVVFFNVSADTEIKIYDSTGTLVYEVKGDTGWTGKDSSGKQLPSGVYFYQMKNENGTFTGTITLVR